MIARSFYDLIIYSLRTPRPATRVSRALRTQSVTRVSPRVSPVSDGVSGGVLKALGDTQVSTKCPKRVPGVSKKCPGHSGDTLRTLFGHSGGRGRKPPETRRRAFSQTHPVCGDTLGDTLRTLRARRARESHVAGRGVRKA